MTSGITDEGVDGSRCFRRSTRIATKNAKHKEYCVIDLTSPSPPPKKRAGNKRDTPATASLSPDVLGQRLDETADDLIKCLHSDGEVDVQQLDIIAEKMKLIARDLKSCGMQFPAESMESDSEYSDSSKTRSFVDGVGGCDLDSHHEEEESDDGSADDVSSRRKSYEMKRPTNDPEETSESDLESYYSADERSNGGGEDDCSGGSSILKEKVNNDRFSDGYTCANADNLGYATPAKGYESPKSGVYNSGTRPQGHHQSHQECSSSSAKFTPKSPKESEASSPKAKISSPDTTPAPKSQQTEYSCDIDNNEDSFDNTAPAKGYESPKPDFGSSTSQLQVQHDSPSADNSTPPKPLKGMEASSPKPTFAAQDPPRNASRLPVSTAQQKTPQKPSSLSEDTRESVPTFHNNHGAVLPPPPGGVGRPADVSQSVCFTPTNNKPPVKAKKKCTMEEQEELANKVLCAGSLYEILDLPTTASNEQVKRAYKKKALKVHPDQNKAPKAAEAFRTLNSAYEVLMSPRQRADYNRNNSQSETDTNNGPGSAAGGGNSPNSNGQFPPGSSSFNTFPVGTRVTVQDPEMWPYRQKGFVQSFNAQTRKYRVLVDGGSIVEAEAFDLLQNISVELREAVRKFEVRGVRSVSLISSSVDRLLQRIVYEANCTPQGVRLFCSYKFIIPNGTIVRLEGLEQKAKYNGSYGQVVGWKERNVIGNDLSLYDIQMSPTTILRVKVANVCL